MHRSLGSIISLSCVLGSLALLTDVYAQPQEQKLNAERTNHFSMTSDPLPTPITFDGDPQAAKVTTIELAGEVPSGETGPAEMMLGESTYSFNAFGDAQLTQRKPSRKLSVQLRLQNKTANFGSLFEVTFNELPFKQHVYLVFMKMGTQLSELQIGEHRQNIDGFAGLEPEQIIILQSTTSPETRPVSRQVLRKQIHMSSNRFATGEHRVLGAIGINGRLGDKGTLTLQYHWDPKAAQIDFPPLRPVTFKPLNLPDPAGMNRRIYSVDFEKPSTLGELSIVTLPEAIGPHRLVLSQGGQVKWVLRLTPAGVSRWEELQASTQQLPESERNAVAQLSEAVLENFFTHYLIQKGHVVSLKLYYDNASRESLAILPAFPELHDLLIYKPNLTTAELAAGLRKLPTLKKLDLIEIGVEDEVFKAVAELPQLESLTIQNTVKAATITDEHLQLLSHSPSVKRLKLMAANVTDAGLLHLAEMGQLSNVDLGSRQTTSEGTRVFRSRLPKCVLRINGEKVE